MGKPIKVADLAELLGMSATWVYLQVESGTIPHTRLPTINGGKRGRIRFTEEHVQQILAGGDQPVVNLTGPKFTGRAA